MKIGFDGKRAFHNTTGLGNYSRTLIRGLATWYPEHEYYLFNPKPSRKFSKPVFPQVHEILPAGFINKTFSSAWRSAWVKKDLRQLGIQLYHGLSHEIPHGIQHTAIPSVVTIHDLIFERYPEQFGKINVQIYRHKFQYACRNANRIIAISQQTKLDIIQLYGIREDKIDVCYQSCDPAFAEVISEEDKERARNRYNLPPQFFLYVGSIIERKNLLGICEALHINRNETLPLVVIGDGGTYKQKVKSYIIDKGLADRVIFLSEKHPIGKDPRELATIYQMAKALVYPSFYEGFGIPVLEAMWSGVPVITSSGSCLQETGGNAPVYVEPSSPDSIATAMKRIQDNEDRRKEMIIRGHEQAQNFTLQKCTDELMKVYKKLVYE
jgi:glycosyltransferase involved in cell wall biosynthesis